MNCHVMLEILNFIRISTSLTLMRALPRWVFLKTVLLRNQKKRVSWKIFERQNFEKKHRDLWCSFYNLKKGYDLSWKQEMGNCSPEISRFDEDRIQIIYRLTFKVRLSWLFGRIKISNLSNIKIISKCRSTSRKSETKLTSEPSEGIRKSFLFWWIF